MPSRAKGGATANEQMTCDMLKNATSTLRVIGTGPVDAVQFARLENGDHMSQAYSDPTRADDPHALPDVEVFHVGVREFVDAVEADDDTWMHQMAIDLDPSPFTNSLDRHYIDCSSLGGWYWWACFPGCMPDSDPIGPFQTEAEALEDAQDID